jgi:hypothetical protein
MIFTFAKEGDGTPMEDNQANVGMEFDARILDDIVANFEDFLRGCGFEFDGHLDFVEDEQAKACN